MGRIGPVLAVAVGVLAMAAVAWGGSPGRAPDVDVLARRGNERLAVRYQATARDPICMVTWTDGAHSLVATPNAYDARWCHIQDGRAHLAGACLYDGVLAQFRLELRDGRPQATVEGTGELEYSLTVEDAGYTRRLLALPPEGAMLRCERGGSALIQGP